MHRCTVCLLCVTNVLLTVVLILVADFSTSWSRHFMEDRLLFELAPGGSLGRFVQESHLPDFRDTVLELWSTRSAWPALLPKCIAFVLVLTNVCAIIVTVGHRGRWPRARHEV